jgi:MFS family permease
MIDKVSSYFGRFKKVYWVSMLFELFERGAYYSFTPIIYYHAAYNLHVPEWIALQIFTFLWPIQYGLPILSGALVEKIGYRRQILIAFCLMTFAYFFLSQAVNTFTLIFAVMVLGFSIGTYKPLISAIVAKVTTSEDRTYAFGIYYWIVNLAAAFFPVGYAIYAFVNYGGEFPKEVYYLIFIVGGIQVSFNIIIALFFFEDIPKSEKVRTIRDAINNVKISMADKKFMVLVLLVAGFWALYSMQLTGIIAIIYGYRWVPSWFNPIIYAIFNPMTIVIAGPSISKFIERVESIRVILAGVLVYIAGLIVLTFGVANWTTLVTGIVIMGVGEFMVAPGYYSFTSKLATEDKVSAYIGSTFISTLLGLAMGSIVLGILATYLVVDIQMPYFFLGIAIAFSFMLFIGFLVYYQMWGQDVISRAKRIAEEEEGKKEIAIADDYKEPILFRIYETKAPILISLVIIPIILFSTFSLGTFTYYGPEEEVVEEGIPLFNPLDFPVIVEDLESFSGTLDEGASDTFTVTVKIGEGELLEEGQVLKNITVKLTWQDEPDPGPMRTNTPDVFDLNVTHDDGWTKNLFKQNEQGQMQTITINREPFHQYFNSTSGTGEWKIRVTLLNAGWHTIPPRGREVRNSDTSNAFQLEVSYFIYSKS